MAVELVTVYTGSIASGASSISIDVAKGWARIYAQIPTMSTQAAIDVYGSTNGTTFFQVFAKVPTLTTSVLPAVIISIQSSIIGSAVGTNGGIVPIFAAGCRYLQFRATAVVSGGVAMSLICTD